MQKILYLFLVFTVLLSGCSIDWNGSEKNKLAELEIKLNQLENQEKENLVQKKQDCINTDINKMPEYRRYSHIHIEFFYSSIIDSCLWQYEIMPVNKAPLVLSGNKQEVLMTNSVYEIKDVWNSKIIFSTENKEEFLKKIDELKF